MGQVEITTVSAKGQITIPQGIRKKLKVVEGTKFVVYGSGDNMIFKKLESPARKDFERLTVLGRTHAKKLGIKSEEDVMRIT